MKASFSFRALLASTPSASFPGQVIADVVCRRDDKMFVLSMGMQKSASLLLTRYAINLIRSALPSNGQLEFEGLIRDGVLHGVGCFPWGGWEHKRELLCGLAEEHGPFVVKSHAPLTQPIQCLIAAGAKAIYSMRDPRDILLSLIDHGALNKSRGGGVFDEHTTVANTLPKVMEICVCAYTWSQSDLPCIFQYRDLVSQPHAEIVRLAKFLGIDADQKVVEAIVEKERRTREKGKDCFNTGLLTRFKDEMSPDEIKRCNDTLGFYIKELGYPLD